MNQLTLLTTGIKQEELSCTALGDGVAIFLALTQALASHLATR
ncbi:MAG: hypothetical protein RI964_444 [Pseudomonadota bacterium]|jgi:hypothetical protein